MKSISILACRSSSSSFDTSSSFLKIYPRLVILSTARRFSKNLECEVFVGVSGKSKLSFCLMNFIVFSHPILPGSNFNRSLNSYLSKYRIIFLLLFVDGLGESLFWNLSSVNFIFDWVGGNQSVNYNISLLSYSVASVDALIVVCRVPIRIEDDRSICTHEI